MARNTSLFLVGACAILAVLAVAAPASRQQQGIHVVLIDGDRVTTETEIGRKVRERFEAAANDWQGRISAAQNELQTLMQNRQQQALTLSAAALADLDAQIEEKRVALQRMQDDARRALERIQTAGTQEVNEVLVPALEAMAAEQGYDLVLDSRMTQTGHLLYFSPALDVTDAFIARVNGATQEQAQPQQGQQRP